MNGHYKANEFDIARAKEFVVELEGAQLPIKVEWKEGLKKSDEVFGLFITAHEKLLFSQLKTGGYVNTGMLKHEEEKVFFSILKKYSQHHVAPSAGKAYGLFALYGIIQALGHWSLGTHPSTSSWLLTLSMFGAIATFTLVLFHHLNPEPDDSTWRTRRGFLLLAPGFILTVPAALLVMPMIGYGARKRLFDRLDATSG